MKKTFLVMAMVIALAMSTMAGAFAGVTSSGNAANSLGKTTVGTDASEWTSDTASNVDDGIFPIGGSGQVNGEFTIAEVQGVEIGLRAQERFEGTLEATGNRIGVYEATAIEGSAEDNTGSWNYDWHIDLRDGTNAHADRTLSDYTVMLETDHTNGQNLFGSSVPLDLTFGSEVLDNAVLYQSSQNPGFGNGVFDPSAAKTYNLRLVLTPKTFNGPPLAVAIQVNVTT